MSFLRRGLETRGSYPQYNSQVNPLNTLYGQTSLWSVAGERVDEVTALGVASVLSAVSLLADSVASMPLRCYVKGEQVEVPPVLADPDPAESTSFELKHAVVASLALHGNAYVHIDRATSSRTFPDGEPVGLTPLHPYQMNVQPNQKMTGRTYLHLGREIPREDMLHIRWFTTPQSLVGISPLLQQRTIVGLALAMDRYLAQWYGEGGTPSGVLSTDQPLNTEAMKATRESWEASQRKHRRPAVLANGLKWQSIQTSAVDMEFNATRDAVIAEVGRIFRIPPYLLGTKSDGMTYQNVEQASLNFLIHTLQPWLTRLEIAFSTLLPPGMEVRFDASSLLRMDALTRAQTDKINIAIGKLNPNEARVRDGELPYPGGDEFVQVFQGAAIDPAAVGAAAAADSMAGA